MSLWHEFCIAKISISVKTGDCIVTYHAMLYKGAPFRRSGMMISFKVFLIFYHYQFYYPFLFPNFPTHYFFNGQFQALPTFHSWPKCCTTFSLLLFLTFCYYSPSPIYFSPNPQIPTSPFFCFLK